MSPQEKISDALMEGKYFGHLKGRQEKMPGKSPGILILYCAVR
jgi:hypothetical protein